MAKLKAPLLSLGASGAIGKSIVYFPWKGLNVAREYVVPANPKTTAQNAQRALLIAAVAGIHAAMADAVDPLGDDDRSAYAMLGGLQPTPRTWFNTCVKVIVDQLVAELSWALFTGVEVTPGEESLTVTMAMPVSSDPAATDGKLYYGTSKSAMLNSLDTTVAELAAGQPIPDLTPGVKYYVQYRPDTPVDYIGCRSGIVYGVPLVPAP